MHPRFVLPALIACVAIAACTGDNKQACPAIVIANATYLFDPQNLVCEPWDAPCDDACGQCVTPEGPLPAWPPCTDLELTSTACELDEATCAATAGCRVALDYDAYTAGAGSADDFFGCLPLDPAPAVVGTCAAFDAEQCASTPTCSALYAAGGGACPQVTTAIDRTCGDVFMGCVDAPE